MTAAFTCAGLAVLLLAGCNQVFGLDPGTGGDPPIDAADLGDGARADASSGFGPWGNAATLIAAPLVNEDDAILSADGQELIYAVSSAAAPNKDLMRATLENGTWTAGVPLDTLNSAVTDSTPRFGAGDLAIYVATDRPITQGQNDVWRATRSTTADAWQTPVQLPALSSAGDDRTPSPFLDDTRFVLLTTRDGPIEMIELIPGEASIAIDVAPLTPVSPFITADGTTLYFAAFVTASTDYDLYVMQRASLAAPWGPPQRIDELATTANETDPWVSADGRHLVFSRDQAGASDVWESFREPL
jgi:hypothetical protein